MQLYPRLCSSGHSNLYSCLLFARLLLSPPVGIVSPDRRPVVQWLSFSGFCYLFFVVHFQVHISYHYDCGFTGGVLKGFVIWEGFDRRAFGHAHANRCLSGRIVLLLSLKQNISERDGFGLFIRHHYTVVDR